MTPEKIIAVVETYEKLLTQQGVAKVRLAEHRTFKSASEEELLEHAHYLCEGTKVLARDPEKRRRVGSHLTVIQMCLSFAGWYTRGEIMKHSKP